MTELKCNAIHCLSNRDNRCCRSDIRIGGENATETAATCCESFHRIFSEAKNAADCGCANTTMPISCEAANCMYNSNRKCTAKTVQVIGRSAEDMKDTACETFQCRNCSI